MQELTNNTLKHANASKVALQLISDHLGFEMRYEDNGIGFDLEKNKKDYNGLGIRSIESRSSSLNATIEIKTQKNQGFKFRLIFKNSDRNENLI